MRLPRQCGPVSAAVIDVLVGGDPADLPTTVTAPEDALADDDLQVALWSLYELHYRGFDDVADDLEWEPQLIALRRCLEIRLLAALRAEVTVEQDTGRVADRLRRLIDADHGPPLSRFMQTQADRNQWSELVMQRSVYQLKEADPHTWAIPRLPLRAKSALVEIQTDEYGGGDPARMHSELFRVLMRELCLRDDNGAYVDVVPGITLAISNTMSMFGLRREFRGAAVGHLAAYEMTSSEPCRRYAKGLRRLGVSDAACAFYDVHVTADALHEQLAAHDLCEGLAAAEPDLTEDILFGAAACLAVDNRFARHVWDSWSAGRSSLRADHAVQEAVS
ncbi:MAG TPA: iron-containing redox enzyme family protein [Microlunatus sp.]|nr:iron-containing redox enzyme family protein [Microlunatus sp.]